MKPKPLNILQKTFGYNQFRDGQEEIISTILSGRDTIVLMPTGGGKSLCFQIPALCMDGITLVISPLISLMKDQVESLKMNGVEAAYFNSSLDSESKEKLLSAVHSAKIKLLYLAPESLFNQNNSWFLNLDPAMVAIDEAHCVSMWGHDFRPEYKEMKSLRQRWKNSVFCAFTATADKLTRLDITTHLGLENPKVFINSFDRENLHLNVRGNLPKHKKLSEIVSFISANHTESGIIYCLSRKETESMRDELYAHGIVSESYHAGLDFDERSRIQEGFLRDDLKIVCATIAFGMGIDKSNVRWVIHNNLPKNLESYYQEIGRAGRDSLASKTLLYYNYRDVKLLSDFAKESPHQEVLLEKLNRMIQYVEATSCRRRILLSYFSEELEENCNNCDVCNNPPAFFDGTKYAQMALSAIKRIGRPINTNLLIEVLRGAKTADVYSKNLHTIKTYGIGSNLSWNEWQHYITEFKNHGLVEIAYNEGMSLKITSYGERVLYGQSTVWISEALKKIVGEKGNAKSIKTAVSYDEQLFDRLRLLRKKLAVEKNVPAYLIFSDAALQDMSIKKPTNNLQILEVNGVGELKAKHYGSIFTELITLYLEENPVLT